MKNIYPILAPQLASILRLVQADILSRVTEVRLRISRPLMLVFKDTDIMINLESALTENPDEAYLCTQDDLVKTLQLISKNSRYAVEEELRLGFLTIQGGHRIGFCGQIALEEGRIKTFKQISGMNIRIAREVKGCSEKILPYICDNKRVLSTLIISPPRCGKTTLLRDIIRNLSYKGLQVGIVDERSEVAACLEGVPTVDMGPRTDVLDACPKACGMLMLIRSMGPQVLATDELGRKEDALAVREALNAGVRVIATVHGTDEKEVLARPYIGELVKCQYFERYIILENTPQIGTVRRVISREGKALYIS